jgi:hypothetical protein
MHFGSHLQYWLPCTALYVVLIKYFWLIIYRQKLFGVYRNNFLNRYNELNWTILIKIARRYINGLHFLICRPINFHSEVPVRVPTDGKHDASQGFSLIVYRCVPLWICFIRNSQKRLSIEVITSFSLRTSLWAEGLGEYMRTLENVLREKIHINL